MSDKINNDEDKPSMISKSRCNCDDKIGLKTDNSRPRADDNDRESADAVTPDQTEVKGDGKAPERDKNKRSRIMAELKEYVQALIIAIIAAFFIITFVAQSFVVEGASMEPTLHNGERVLTEKVSYKFSTPNRGDIIVLKRPGRPFIKRIIAIEGDTLWISEGDVYLNGEVLDEPYIKEATKGTWGPYTVPEGKVFVMGDNRNNSDDSRISVGYLDVKDIKGRAIFRFYPFDKMTVFSSPYDT